MQMTSLDTLQPLKPPAEIPEKAAPAGKDEAGNGQEFAQLIGGALARLQRAAAAGGSGEQGQEFAADGDADKKTAGLTADSDVPLTEIALGPGLHVITATQAIPDPGSLHEFARAQGLNEQAIRWLFGQAEARLPGSGAAGALPAAAAYRDGWATLAANPAASTLSASPTAALATPPGLLTPPSPTPSDVTAATLAGGISSATGTLDLARDFADWLQSASAGEAVGKIPVSATSGAPGQANFDLALIEAMKNWGDRSAGTAALATALGADSAAAATADNAIDGDLQNGQVGKLDLPAPLRAGITASADSVVKPSLETLLQNRNDEAQRLASRMGEAVAQRMLNEIANGNWQLKLSLRPATLGKIDIDMRLHDGGLNAAFAASHAVTRDLLNDGLGRLRDTLTQAGMDVAQLQVGDGQARRNDGDPTPRQPAQWQSKTEDEGSRAVDAVPEAASGKVDKDGLDVLV